MCLRATGLVVPNDTGKPPGSGSNYNYSVPNTAPVSNVTMKRFFTARSQYSIYNYFGHMLPRARNPGVC